MTKKCLGCGSLLQYKDENREGYVDFENYDKSTLCKRCFRLKNYGEMVLKQEDNSKFIDILKSISKTNSLVLYLVDLFTLNNNIENINKYLKNKTILVITKRDLMPKSIRNSKLIDYIKKLNNKNNIIDIIITSSKNNEGLDELYDKIKKYQTDKNVYIVGNTNAGKSTLINKLIKNYSNNESNITESIMPSTTLNQLKVVLDENLTLIDTPGLIDEENIINYVDMKLLKRIIPKKEIKPKTFQLNTGKSIEVENLIRLDYIKGDKNSFTTYFSNDLRVMQINISTHKTDFKNHKKYTFELNGREDIIINGLGYIKIVNKGIVDIYVNEKVSVIKRDSII